jgi:hypothetical protein
MKWVTRERPKIDRIACPWLITRFIDKEAELLYVPADQVLTVAETSGADTARLDIAPQAAGLLALSLGLSHNFADDHAMLAQGMVMYDALYAWCRHTQQETHSWNYPA